MRACQGRYGFGLLFRENNFASEAVNRISRLDRDHTVPTLALGPEADSDSPAMQGAVMQPAKFPVGQVEIGQIFACELLAGEKEVAVHLRDTRALAHRIAT